MVAKIWTNIIYKPGRFPFCPEFRLFGIIGESAGDGFHKFMQIN